MIYPQCVPINISTADTFLLDKESSVPVTLASNDSLQLSEDAEAKLWLHLPTVGKNGANAGI